MDAPHLAHTESLPPGRVLSAPWAMATTLFIGIAPAFLTALPLIFLAGLASLAKSVWTTWTVLGGVGMSMSILAFWLLSYPEWPTNRCLHWRLNRVVRRRGKHALVSPNRQTRMAEWVPRENWRSPRLETAADVMLLRVDRDGVWMEGDRARYHFTPSSLIDVSLQSVRPAGCFHQLHFVVLIVRTDKGPVEYPIAYRDHGLTSLSSHARYIDAAELCQQIAAIATGGDFTVHPAHESVQRPQPKQRLNPFAAPPTV
ncbi:MAG: hypothetical protein AAFX06_12095 [Planctomycetota bacterium]